MFQVFFAASDRVLDNEDIIDSTEADAEILGAGVLMAYTLITPLMLLAYAVEGRKVIQVKINRQTLIFLVVVVVYSR